MKGLKGLGNSQNSERREGPNISNGNGGFTLIVTYTILAK